MRMDSTRRRRSRPLLRHRWRILRRLSSALRRGNSAKSLDLAISRESYCGFLDFMGGWMADRRQSIGDSGSILFRCFEISP